MTPPSSPAPASGVGRRWPRAALFDLDGTLVDTAPDIAAAVNRMLAELDRPQHTADRILNWIGEGSPRLVRRALTGGNEEKELPESEIERGLSLFLEHYASGICDRSVVYPDAGRVLHGLREAGVGTACVTNKPEHMSRLLIDALRLTSMFDVIVGGDTLQFRKPRPEPIHYACHRLGVEAADAVYVGDSMTDCLAADAAGVAMVAVTYGYNHGADLTSAPCKAIIDGLDELPAVLTEIQPEK